MDVDLDAYADDTDSANSGKSQPVESQIVQPVEEKRVSTLEAAELARMPLEELLPKLNR